jgi:hypothetical protein
MGEDDIENIFSELFNCQDIAYMLKSNTGRSLWIWNFKGELRLEENRMMDDYFTSKLNNDFT